jgi:hypothetical protein
MGIVVWVGGTLKVTTPLADYFFYPQLELITEIISGQEEY